MVRKIELMMVQGEIKFNVAPPRLELGEYVSFSGSFRVGVTPATGKTVHIFLIGEPDLLVGSGVVDKKGHFSDFWKPTRPGINKFYAVSYSPTAMSKPQPVVVEGEKPTRVFPMLGGLLDWILA